VNARAAAQCGWPAWRRPSGLGRLPSGDEGAVGAIELALPTGELLVGGLDVALGFGAVDAAGGDGLIDEHEHLVVSGVGHRAARPAESPPPTATTPERSLRGRGRHGGTGPSF
jgi:hypothetical protein